MTATPDRELWTLAYRNRRANRFLRVDLKLTWRQATELARLIEPGPALQVWVVTTKEAEEVGYVDPEDVGNVLADTGRRVRIAEGGLLADLGGTEITVVAACDNVRRGVDHFNQQAARWGDPVD